MPLLDRVHKQATQILLNHVEIPMIMYNIYNSIPASHIDFSIISFEFGFENESRILMHFHSYFGRIATFSVLSCQKMLFIDIQTFPDTRKQQCNKVYLEPRIEGYPLILSNLSYFMLTGFPPLPVKFSTYYDVAIS